mgnify:CR=1 FL=1
MSKAWALARREVGVMFRGSLAWTLIGGVTFLAGHFFYSDLTFYVLFGGGHLPAGLRRTAPPARLRDERGTATAIMVAKARRDLSELVPAVRSIQVFELEE